MDNNHYIIEGENFGQAAGLQIYAKKPWENGTSQVLRK